MGHFAVWTVSKYPKKSVISWSLFICVHLANGPSLKKLCFHPNLWDFYFSFSYLYSKHINFFDHFSNFCTRPIWVCTVKTMIVGLISLFVVLQYTNIHSNRTKYYYFKSKRSSWTDICAKKIESKPKIHTLA